MKILLDDLDKTILEFLEEKGGMTKGEIQEYFKREDPHKIQKKLDDLLWNHFIAKGLKYNEEKGNIPAYYRVYYEVLEYE